MSARLIAQRAGVVNELLARSAHFGDHVQAEEFDVIDHLPFGLIDVGSLLASCLLDFVEHQANVADFVHERMQVGLLSVDRFVDERVTVVLVLSDLTFITEREWDRETIDEEGQRTNQVNT